MSELTPEQKYRQANDLLTIAQATFSRQTEEEAVELLKQSAQAGHAAAWIRLGECYDGGIGVEFNDSEEMNCYKAAADLGNQEAIVHYAYKQFYRIRNHEEAYTYIQKALNNDAKGEAHYLLGLLYYHGRGTERNYEKSYASHVESANRGNSDAMFELYVYHSQGIGCERDPQKAFEWNTKAAGRGHYRACYNQGWHYENGSFVEKDIDKAFSYYTTASEKGNGKATAYLGVMLQKGMVKPAETLDKQGNWDADKAKELAEEYYLLAEEENDFYEINDFLENLEIER
jgi:hypothetical protein